MSDILFIGRQEELSESFEKLRKILQFDNIYQLPNDPIKAHKMPTEFDIKLSKIAINNIQKYYKRDYELLDFLEKNNMIN
jgi:hypothetical protein